MVHYGGDVMKYYKKGTMYISSEMDFDLPEISKEEFDEHFSEAINRETHNETRANTIITMGKYFSVNGETYKAITTIPAGDIINPGTNCKKVNITDLLNN
jgi:hypothetical protein